MEIRQLTLIILFCMVMCKEWIKKGSSKNFGMMSTSKTKKGKTSKFVDAGGYNRNEREGNFQLGVGRLRRVEKKNKIKTLGTETCENKETVYKKNKNIV